MPVPYIVPYPVYVGTADDTPEPDPQEGDAPLPAEEPPPPGFALDPVPTPAPAFVPPADQPCQAPQPVPQAQPEPPWVYIASNDQTVYTAIAYWVVGETLHYVTQSGIHNQISIRLVNRKLSKQLNSQRPIELILPPE